MTPKRRRLAMLAGLFALMPGLPGCESFRGLHWGWNRTDGGDPRNVSYRPAYESFSGRPIYPGGYAGIDYNADSPRRVRVPAAIPGAADGPVPTVTIDQGGWESH